MLREHTYQKNLKIILEAIKGRGIKTAEKMIREEIYMSEHAEKQGEEDGLV